MKPETEIGLKRRLNYMLSIIALILGIVLHIYEGPGSALLAVSICFVIQSILFEAQGLEKYEDAKAYNATIEGYKKWISKYTDLFEKLKAKYDNPDAK